MVTQPTFWLCVLIGAPIFWFLPTRWRTGFLALLSVGYLVYLDRLSAAVLSTWAVVFYFAAPLRSRYPRIPIAALLVLGILSCLAFFKYATPVRELFQFESWGGKVAIPLGISFYTFRLLHYGSLVGKGKVSTPSVAEFVNYAFFFPIVTAGPIERVEHFLGNRRPTWDYQLLVLGGTRICHGLIKKFLLARMLVPRNFGLSQVDSLQSVVGQLDELSPPAVSLCLVLNFLVAYLDFSAYSDVAVGASRLFGFEIAENFNFPFLASNIGEFWKRWHMTLAGLCQYFIYMPLIGLTRSPYRATFATFIIMGLWHAGSLHWVCWGAWHAIGVSVYVYYSRTLLRRIRPWTQRTYWRVASICLTCWFVSLGGAFSGLHGTGTIMDSLRLLRKAIFWF